MNSALTESPVEASLARAGDRRALGATTGVMQIIDTLHPGGLERVAVNVANSLPRGGYRSFLCATREEGMLAAAVAPHVGRLALARRRRLDPAAILRMNAFIRRHEIRILHAHGSSLFIAAAASLLPPFPAVVWHDHFGAAQIASRPAALYALALRRVGAVIAVNPRLAQWSRRRGVADARIQYIPNFVSDAYSSTDAVLLPGVDGARVVCVAHFRPQKDHVTLVRAWAIVNRRCPEAHLVLAGSGSDPAYVASIRDEIARHHLESSVTLLGQINDVPGILRGCDIGVLSSASEGFPLALLEYGRAGVAAVATNVGQCAEVLDDGKAGLLVRPQNPSALAEAIIGLLIDPRTRAKFASKLRQRAECDFGEAPIMRRVCAVYERLHPKTTHFSGATPSE